MVYKLEIKESKQDTQYKGPYSHF